MLACLAISCAQPAPDVLKAMERVNDEVGSGVRIKFERLAKLAGEFGAAPRGLSNPQLRDAFKATSMTFFYASLSGDRDADQWLDRLEVVYRELQQRGLVEDAQTIELFDHLLTMRRFDDAAALKHEPARLPIATSPPCISRAASTRRSAQR